MNQTRGGAVGSPAAPALEAGMTRTAVLIAALAAALSALAPAGAEAAKERNQRQNLDPRMNAKVQDFKAQA